MWKVFEIEQNQIFEVFLLEIFLKYLCGERRKKKSRVTKICETVKLEWMNDVDDGDGDDDDETERRDSSESSTRAVKISNRCRYVCECVCVCGGRRGDKNIIRVKRKKTSKQFWDKMDIKKKNKL